MDYKYTLNKIGIKSSVRACVEMSLDGRAKHKQQAEHI